MSTDRPGPPPSIRRRFLVSLRQDFLFWLSLIVTAWIVFLVPQVHDIIFQTAQGSSSPESRRITSGAAWVPFFYLLYLALILSGTVASILFVVPPSLLSVEGRTLQPVPPPELSRAAVLRKLGVLLVLALGGFLDITKWLGDLYPWLPVLLLSWLIFPWVGYAVFHGSAWLVRAAERWPILCGRRFALSLALAGLGLWVLVSLLELNTSHQPRHPLGLLALNGLGLVFILVGFWLGCLARGAMGEPLAEASGRLIGWLVCGVLGGEAIWLFASLRIGIVEGFAYRLYTVWSILELLVLAILVASLLDTWEESAEAPLRLAGLFALTLLGLLSRLPGTETLEAPSAAPVRTTPADWPRHFLARIRQIPQGEPIVLVAASGGGSRAAVFSGLVLEALAREPFPGVTNSTWGDHVVLISSVSGGSLGTARFVHQLGSGEGQVMNARRENLRHSFRMDLVGRMKGVAEELREQYRGANVESRLRRKFGDEIDPKHLDAFFMDCKKALWQAKYGYPEGDWAWVLESPIMDDLCTDFIAPALRGSLMPLLSRGASLRLFWRDQFAWNGSNDRGGYSGPDSERIDWQHYPLVIFNASDAQRGSRLAFGFPPLPPGFRMTGRVRKSTLDEEAYHPPQTLADLDPERSIDLHQAVFLSANFPLGFESLSIPRRNASDRDTSSARILDGGIVDNTGIDSLFLTLRGIREARDAQDAICTEIWNELENRRVLLIEINSGRKPAATSGPVSRWFSPLHDPSTAQKHARFDHAGLAKRHYLGMLRDWLRDRETVGDRFASIQIECTHLGQSNVQTSWSLGPQDKARVLVRFLLEMDMHRNELKEWGEACVKELLPRAGEGRDWQARFNERAVLSREMYARTW